MNKLTSLLIVGLLIPLFGMSEIMYSVSFKESNSHYVQITMSTHVTKGEALMAKMPVWAPGSYKVRDFSQNVDAFNATIGSDKKECVVERITKNSWKVTAEKSGIIELTYKVYAFDLGVRTSYVDQYMAFLHGTSAFMYLAGKENDAIVLEIIPNSQWQNVEVSLPKIKGAVHQYSCVNYDLLADSPMALGNFDIGNYKSGNVDHKVVMIGTGNYQMDKIVADFKLITDKEVDLFGDHPSPQYIHFIQNVDNGGGGLEHLNSQTSQFNRFSYTDETKYRNFLGLIAHEYFHLWNVKRIRPIELGPFNYENENYTDMLWVAEGITSYYDDLFLRRVGLHTNETYLSAVATNINRLQNQPGRAVMNLVESSKLAWVKAYLPNENSNNVTISYYNKGMLVAWMLDMEIMERTTGKKRLDDVMRMLYERFYKQQDRGFTHQEFKDVCSDVAGSSLKAFFDDNVHGTEEITYQKYLDLTGIELVNTPSEKSSIGVKVKSENGKSVITYIHPKGSALASGLSVNDEIIAIDDWRVKGELTDDLNRYQAEDKVVILYNRDGKLRSVDCTIEKDGEVNYKVAVKAEQTETQKKYFELWMGGE
ncbi:MAG: putative metalloprotease with PDZ domain [Bacteroidia bacterium]|jgi:predicted metalloprotease with PDZ domain